MNNMHSIHESARSGDLKRVKELLQNNPGQVNSKDKIGETPLHYAAGNGHKAVAELLLANNGDVNAKDNDGGTPLLWAAACGHKSVVELLLANKADVNAKDNGGNTPLQRAALKGHKAVVKLLRRHGAIATNHIFQPVTELRRIPLVILFIIGVFILFIIGRGISFKHSISLKLCFFLVVIIAFYATLILVIIARKKKRNTIVSYFLDRLISSDYIQNARELPEKRLINTILRDKSIPTASESLIVWGSIDLVMWFVQHVKIVDLLSKIDILSGGTFTFILYGGCIIAVGMLAFGVFGQVTKSTLVGYLNGIVLIAVGLWNFNFNNALANAVRLYGYELTEKGFNIFEILGLFQCIWGLLQIYSFWRFGFQPRGMNKAAKDDALTRLQKITRSPAKPDAGRFKITIPTSLLQSLYAGIRHGGTYTVWLLPYKACCLHDKLDDYFEYDRRAIAGLQFNNSIEYLMNRDIKIQFDTRLIKFKKHSIVLGESALKSFNDWLRLEL